MACLLLLLFCCRLAGIEYVVELAVLIGVSNAGLLPHHPSVQRRSEALAHGTR
jgi:hypothetical protein